MEGVVHVEGRLVVAGTVLHIMGGYLSRREFVTTGRIIYTRTTLGTRGAGMCRRMSALSALRRCTEASCLKFKPHGFNDDKRGLTLSTKLVHESTSNMWCLTMLHRGSSCCRWWLLLIMCRRASKSMWE
jgi:hypothetical protein